MFGKKKIRNFLLLIFYTAITVFVVLHSVCGKGARREEKNRFLFQVRNGGEITPHLTHGRGETLSSFPLLIKRQKERKRENTLVSNN